MGHLFSRHLKSWLAIRASLCANGQWLYLVPSAPLPLFTAIGGGVLVAAMGWGLHVMLRSGSGVVVAGLVLGGIVAIGGRQLWRFTAPVVSINRQRGEVVLHQGQSILSLQKVAQLKLSIYADHWRGYREMELTVVLAPGDSEQKVFIFNRASMELFPDDSDRRILLFSRNNFDNDPFRFHGDSPDDEMEDVARTLAEEINLPVHIERKTEWDVLPSPLA